MWQAHPRTCVQQQSEKKEKIRKNNIHPSQIVSREYVASEQPMFYLFPPGGYTIPPSLGWKGLLLSRGSKWAHLGDTIFPNGRQVKGYRNIKSGVIEGRGVPSAASYHWFSTHQSWATSHSQTNAQSNPQDQINQHQHIHQQSHHQPTSLEMVRVWLRWADWLRMTDELMSRSFC